MAFYRNKKVRVLKAREHYAADFALVLRQTSDDEEVTLQVRRVIPPGQQEELQIEISQVRIGQKRNTQMHSSLCLPPDLADLLAEACATLRKKDAA